MSTISSNADINTKYQRIAAEYAKLKAQIPVLKNAVISEKEKNKQYAEELHAKESALRKLEAENESLEFRNGQLLKRVECLQEEVENALKSSTLKRGSHARRSSRRERTSIDNSVLENELLEKVNENERLHSKVFELEANYEKQLAVLNDRCVALEEENKTLKVDIAKLMADSAPEKTKARDDGAQEGRPATEDARDSSKGDAGDAPGISDVEGTIHALTVDASRSACTLLASFASLLQLFEQRSSIYPNDISLEALPESAVKLGRCLLKSSERFETAGNRLESSVTNALEEGEENFISECVELTPLLADAVELNKELKSLLEESVSRENRLSWSGPSLCRWNEEWMNAFGGLLDSLLELPERIESCSEDSMEHLIELIQKISNSCTECNVTYTKKIFNENRIPTASKRLRCVNECIEKCLASISRNLANFVSLLSLISSSLQQSRQKKYSSSIAGASASEELPVIPGTPTEEKNPLSEVECLSAKPTSPVPSSPPARDYLKHELETARRRIIELEKERERILVEAELVKLRLCGDSSRCRVSGEQNLGNVPADEIELLTTFYEDRIGELVADEQYVRSRAYYYQSECEDLLRRTKIVLEENETLRRECDEANKKIASLNDVLETTQKGYEEQMRTLYEHMEELNRTIESQTATIGSLKSTSNGVDSSRHGSRKLLFK